MSTTGLGPAWVANQQTAALLNVVAKIDEQLGVAIHPANARLNPHNVCFVEVVDIETLQEVGLILARSI